MVTAESNCTKKALRTYCWCFWVKKGLPVEEELMGKSYAAY